MIQVIVIRIVFSMRPLELGNLVFGLYEEPLAGRKRFYSENPRYKNERATKASVHVRVFMHRALQISLFFSMWFSVYLWLP